MVGLLYGVAAVFAFWWLSKVFARANPAVMARLVKRIGGLALIGLAGFLLLRGRIDMAMLVGGGAAWLFGWSLPWQSMRQRTIKSPGAVSRVRSATIDMELDHDTGAMRGTVLAGSFAGRALDDLGEAELQTLHRECAATDGDGQRLLEAYFDRRFPGWRKHAEGDAHARAGSDPQPGAMTEEEAYQILGLQPGASLDEVRRAHRLLMKKLHPDQGGSTYLAARVNAAKETLLSRHR